jgi:CBS domain-containing protein
MGTRALEKLTVRDLMTTALVTARPDETIDDATFDMKMASIRHLPVVGERNRLVGIVSDRDLLRALGARRKEALTMRSIMTRRVRTVGEDAPAAEAVAILIESKIGCLPVEGDDGQLVGLITETDFLRIAGRVLSGHGRQEIVDAGQ